MWAAPLFACFLCLRPDAARASGGGLRTQVEKALRERPPVNVSLDSAINSLQARMRQLKSEEEIAAEEATAAQRATRTICGFQIFQATNFLARSAFNIHVMSEFCPESLKETMEDPQGFRTPMKACLISTSSLVTSISQIASGLSVAAATCAETLNIEALCAVPITAIFTPLSQFIGSSTAASASCSKEAAELPKDIDLVRRRLQEGAQGQGKEEPAKEAAPGSSLLGAVPGVPLPPGPQMPGDDMTENRRWQVGECVIDSTAAVMAMGQLALGFNAATTSCPAQRGDDLLERVSRADCTVDAAVTMFSFARLVLFIALAVEHCAPGDQTDSLCVAACMSLTASATSISFISASLYLNCRLGEDQFAILNGSFEEPAVAKELSKQSQSARKEKLLEGLSLTAGFTRRLSRDELLHELVKESKFERPEDLWLSMGYNFSDPDAPWKKEDPREMAVLEEGREMVKRLQTRRQEPWDRRERPEEPVPNGVPERLVEEGEVNCSERGVLYNLELPGHAVSLERSVAACQARCARTPSCARFSYWPPRRRCSLHGMLAQPMKDDAQWISGPPGCREEQISEATRLATARMESCYHPHATYEPRDQLAPPRRAASAQDCQHRCQRQKGCQHFVFSELDGLCSFAAEGAKKLQPVLYVVGGPRHCPEAELAGLSGLASQRGVAELGVTGPAALFGALVAVAAVAMFWALAVATRRVYCRAAQGDCVE